MQRHRSQPVHGPLFSASEREHNVVLSSSTSPMMRGEDLMVWEPEQEWVLNGLLDARRLPARPCRVGQEDQLQPVHGTLSSAPEQEDTPTPSTKAQRRTSSGSSSGSSSQ